jgi:hypothetical protein
MSDKLGNLEDELKDVRKTIQSLTLCAREVIAERVREDGAGLFPLLAKDIEVKSENKRHILFSWWDGIKNDSTSLPVEVATGSWEKVREYFAEEERKKQDEADRVRANLLEKQLKEEKGLCELLSSKLLKGENHHA